LARGVKRESAIGNRQFAYAKASANKSAILARRSVSEGGGNRLDFSAAQGRKQI
jgi:hypothetical protein